MKKLTGLIFALLTTSLIAENVGWRKDGSGSFPKATPPLTWNQDKDGKTENILWKTEMPNSSASSVIVVGDKLFTASRNYDLVCLDKNTGKILWVKTSSHYDAATPEDRKKKADKWQELDKLAKERDALNDKLPKCAPGKAFKIGEEKMKIEKKMEKLMFQINPKKNKLLKIVDGGYNNGTPASDGKHVYTWDTRGTMTCYDLQGNRKWIQHHPQKLAEHGAHFSPVIIGDIVIGGIHSYVGFDKNNGKLLWESEPYINKSNKGWSGSVSPFELSGKKFFVRPDGMIYDPKTGKKVTEKAIQVYNSVATPVVSENYVAFITSAHPNQWDKRGITYYQLPKEIKEGFKPEAKTPPFPEWDIKILGGKPADSRTFGASPLIHNGIVYFIDSMGYFYAEDLKTGKRLYRQKLDFGKAPLYHGHRPYGCGTFSSPSLAGGNIYVFANNGVCKVIEPGAKFKELASNPIVSEFTYKWKLRQEGFISNPFFEKDKIYYRAQKYLYCIAPKK